MKDLVPNKAPLPASLEQTIGEQFHRWERRGRGWAVFDDPVDPEPQLVPLCLFDFSSAGPIIDDGRHESFFGKLLGNDRDQSFQRHEVAEYRENVASYQQYLEIGDSPQVCTYYDHDFIEYRLIVPQDLEVSRSVAEGLLHSFSHASAPVSFEVIGTDNEIAIQFAVSEVDSNAILQQIKSHLPGCLIRKTACHLLESWQTADEDMLIVDFGLSDEFYLPLNPLGNETDILTTLVGALSDLDRGEVGVFQILFRKTRQNWAEEIRNALYIFEDTNFFDNFPSIRQLTKTKIGRPLFACVARIASRSLHRETSLRIVKSLASAFVPMVQASSNELIPLSNDGYSDEDHERSLLDRQTYRPGMILNSEELVSIVHPPGKRVLSPKLVREIGNTKPAPPIALNNRFVLGTNRHHESIEEVTLSSEQRTRHVHLIGSSGSGKSTLLLGLIKQDMELGQGLCVIDPHGDLIEDIVGNVPDNRIEDVILFDPSDSEFPVGFNILKAHSELEKNLLSSDLVATFRRMSTSWGDVMDSVLANAVLAFVESTTGGTLFDMRRFLVEKAFRDEFLETVVDPSIHYFWKHEFPHLTNRPQASILIRLDSFLRNKIIRNIVCQKDTKLNFRQIMDGRKILLIKLSQGLMGEENARLLGSLFVSRLHQTAFSRQDSGERPFFWLYLDEFQHFVTPSMEGILSGVRKYNMGLHLSHQECRQMQSRSPEVASSVLSNCYTRICFRLGDADAAKLAAGFSFFDGKALLDLGLGEAIARVERSDFDFNLNVERVPEVADEVARQRRQAILENTRVNFAKARDEVEAELMVPGAPAPSSVRSARERPVPGERSEQQGPSHRQSGKEEPSEPKIQGRSGVEASKEENVHRYIQNILKRIGEGKGFVVTLEQQVFGGIGRVDLALENESLRIACEIAHTNTVEYEVRNIQKCLAAGFDHVAVISNDGPHLADIRRSAAAILSGKLSLRVHFLEPGNFHLLLEKLANKQKAGPDVEKIRGYTVNVGFADPIQVDREARENTIADILKNAEDRRSK